MGTSSCVDHIKSAGTEHKCSWCGERILIGESYKRWRWYDSGDVTTCKLHEECLKEQEKESLDGENEFTLYDNPRGQTTQKEES